MSVLVSLSGVPRELAEGVAQRLGLLMITTSRKVFPDGEQYLRLDPNAVRGSERVLILQSMFPEQDSKWVELLLAIEAACNYASKVALVITYLAYARQDRRFLDGEAVSLRALIRSLGGWCVDKLIVIDAHKPEAVLEAAKEAGIEFINVLPFSYMVRKAGMESGIDFVLSPDRGALHRARELARSIGVGYDYLEKYRDRITGEIRVEEKVLDVRGRRVAIVDDIVSTGGTLAKAVELLKRLGAVRVIAVASHALLVGSAVEKLRGAGLDLLITGNTFIRRQTVFERMKVIDLSDLVANVIASAIKG